MLTQMLVQTVEDSNDVFDCKMCVVWKRHNWLNVGELLLYFVEQNGCQHQNVYDNSNCQQSVAAKEQDTASKNALGGMA
ncbi:hypothetical protein Tcan_01948 [Toxocara canis]|uniref:Uncharacterized protein n=2 Tax=Toxocara canis TaxID=6265 RepID=A0A0B2UI19_TOXCA|nr:hypothetical protein Tcan_01948 [Toxocara canis]VDM36923.1 unnamed protein product [Toxocara canis]